MCTKKLDLFFEQQIQQTKSLKKGFVILFSLLTIIIVLFIGDYFLPKYFAISKAFSREMTALNNSQYHATIIKKQPPKWGNDDPTRQ